MHLSRHRRLACLTLACYLIGPQGLLCVVALLDLISSHFFASGLLLAAAIRLCGRHILQRIVVLDLL